MYCYTLSECIQQDLIWTIISLSLIIPALVLVIWRKKVRKRLIIK